jgi:peptidoglycan/xylan/chitin deacetylase (PgdA/CDA1 family)
MASTQNSSAIVLTAHKVSGGRWLDHTCLCPRQLADILQSLLDSGRILTNVCNTIENPRPMQVALTIDDGYAHLIDPLLELAEKFDFRPAVFVPTAYIGRKNSWDYTSIFSSQRHVDRNEIRSLAHAGIEFGSHGHTHRPLTGLGDGDLAMELQISRSILEDTVGRAVDSISYPFGRFDGRVIRAVAEAGYRIGFGSHWPSERSDTLTVGRISLYRWDTPYSVAQKAGGRWEPIEKAKAETARFLSGGTALFQRVRPDHSR